MAQQKKRIPSDEEVREQMLSVPRIHANKGAWRRNVRDPEAALQNIGEHLKGSADAWKVREVHAGYTAANAKIAVAVLESLGHEDDKRVAFVALNPENQDVIAAREVIEHPLHILLSAPGPARQLAVKAAYRNQRIASCLNMMGIQEALAMTETAGGRHLVIDHRVGKDDPWGLHLKTIGFTISSGEARVNSPDIPGLKKALDQYDYYRFLLTERPRQENQILSGK